MKKVADLDILVASQPNFTYSLGPYNASPALTPARLATNKQAQARQLQERMDLAREVHESVIQRAMVEAVRVSGERSLSSSAMPSRVRAA